MVTRAAEDERVTVVPRPRQQQRRLAHDQIADLLVKYTDGTSVLALAEEYGIHRTTVMEILEREGIPRRPCTRRMTDDDVARAAVQYATGQSLAVVGEAFGVSPKTVAREFARAGIATRPQPGAK